MYRGLWLWRAGRLLCCVAASAAWAAPSEIVLREHLGHTWRQELVSYRLEFGPGECQEGTLRLAEEGGGAVPIQLSDVERHGDGSLARATLWFVVPELPALGARTWRVVTGREAPRHETDLHVRKREDVWEITTGKVGVRLLRGSRRFDPALPADGTPAPLQAVRLRDGAWIGHGWWETEMPCTGYRGELTARGPVFAEVRVRLEFAGGKHYAATYRVIAGQEVVLIEEEFDLGDPERFVLPDYGERERLLWDWWGGTQGRAESPNNLCFSIYDPEGFTPDTARWLGHHSTAPEKGSPPAHGGHAQYSLDFSSERLDIVLNSYLQWGDDESVLYTCWDAQRPRSALAVIGIRPSRWVHPNLRGREPGFIKQWTQTNNIGVWAGSRPDLYLRSPVNMGRRAYLLASLDAETEVAPKPGQFDRTGQLLVKYGYKPLDKVKDWVLDWPEEGKHPRLFCAPGDLDALRRRAESQPEYFKSAQGQPLFRYLATGDEKDALKAFEGLISPLRSWRDKCLRGYAPAGSGGDHMYLGLLMLGTGPKVDLVLSCPALTEEQRREARTLLAFVQYCAWDQDHFPGREQGFAWGSANQGTIPLAARAIWAKLLSDHPRADYWAAEGAKFPIYDLERYLHPESGVAQECPGYAGTGTVPDLTALLALSDMVNISPVTPRLRGLVRWRLVTMPPPDPRFGQRTLLTLGDTPYHGDNVLPLLGMLFLDRDPEIARQCFWGYRESGSHGGGFADRIFLIDDSASASPPRVASQNFKGFGAVLRTGTLRPDETYLCYYHGDFSWGHYHSDQGTLVFYAKGAPLLMDFGSQYQPSIRQACFHNTITFNHREREQPRTCPGRGHPDCFYTGKPWFEHDVEPFTCLEYSFAGSESEQPPTGRIVAFAALEPADYARGQQHLHVFNVTPYRYDVPWPIALGTQLDTVQVPAFTWTRQVILVKDEQPLGPNYLFVRDDLTGNQKLEPAFNLWSLTREVRLAGNRAFLPGQWGVDLDVFIAQPSPAEVSIAELAHQNASINAARFRELHGRPFEERQKCLRIFAEPGGEGFAVVVYPRTGDEPEPRFTALSGVPGVKLELPEQTHWVIASRQPVAYTEGRLRFRGTAAVVKRFRDGRVQLALLAPGELSYGRLAVEGRQPQEAEGNP